MNFKARKGNFQAKFYANFYKNRAKQSDEAIEK